MNFKTSKWDWNHFRQPFQLVYTWEQNELQYLDLRSSIPSRLVRRNIKRFPSSYCPYKTTTIDGYIANTNSAYDNTYNNQSILIDEKFLMFEHSDGLNYVNFELRHTDEFLSFKNISISLKEGIGVGFLYPRTNTTLLGKERYDEFHLSGYGISGVLGINITFYDKFFFQTEYKGGFIDMPSVRTTLSKADTASHNFFFSQFNILFGGVIHLKSSKK